MPLLLLAPWAGARAAGAAATMALMALIALTGNYGFFNALTSVLALAVLDDEQAGCAVPPV